MEPLLLSAARGQSHQPFSLQLSGIFVIPGGDAFSGTNPGGGGEIQIRRNLSPISIGIGAQLSMHDIGLPTLMSLRGAFLEPRFVIPGSSLSFAPYLSARVAVFQENISSEGVTGSATGTQINGGGGILIPLGTNLNLDLGATVGLLRFGSFTTRYQGQSYHSPAATGFNFVLRGGVAIGLGS
jgi:hypothetical protein